MSETPDEPLVRRAQAGDAGAFTQLVRRKQQFVFAVAYHILGDAEDARDVAQDAFIRAYSRLGQLREPARFGPWLRQLAINECRAWAAKKKPTEPLDEHRSADRYHRVDERLVVEAALRALDEPSRLTLILFYLHEYSMAEIGDLLEEPVTTIKSRLRNARGKLRRGFEQTMESNIDRQRLPADFAERVAKIIQAAIAMDGPTLRALLEQDPRLADAQDKESLQTPLHYVAGVGNAALVELLLSFGANPNIPDKSDNALPIHYAAERGWLEAVKLMVEAGADVNWTQDMHERGPLGWASVFEFPRFDVADYLIAHGAKLDVFSATALGRLQDVKRIVEQRPSQLQARTSQCDGRFSVIEFATGLRQLEIAEFLASAGAPIGLVEAAGLGWVDALRDRLHEADLGRALKTAVRAGQLETARILLENGADPNYRVGSEHTTLIFDCVKSCDEPMCRLLIEHGADLEGRDGRWNSTALGWEVFFGRPAGVAFALKLGAQVAPNLIDLAKSGENGDLRRWSSGTPSQFREVQRLLGETKP